MLVGRSLQNLADGTISAAQGTIQMVAADKATLSFDANGLVGVILDSEVLENELGLANAVLNSGSLDGASVVIEAHVADNLFASSAINNSGSIAATGIDNSGGSIRLTGPTIEHGGSIIANGEGLGDGGDITIAADETLIVSGSIQAYSANNSGQGGNVVTAAGGRIEISGGDSPVDTLGVSGAAGGSWEIAAKAIHVSDAVDCTENCISGDMVVSALGVNGRVTLSAIGEEVGDGVYISEKVNWSDASTLVLDAKREVKLSGVAPSGPGVQGIAGTHLEIVAADGFTNDNVIEVDSFSLSVGGDGVDSTSTLGDVQVADVLQVSGGTGQDSVSFSGVSGPLQFTASAGAGDTGVVNVADSGAFSATLAEIDIIEAGSSNDILTGSVEDDTFYIVDTGIDFHGVTFEAIAKIDGLADDSGNGGGDVIVGAENSDWTLTNAGVAELQGLDVTGIEILQANNAGLVGKDTGDDFALNQSGEVETAGFRFASLNAVHGNGGADSLDASAFAGDLYLTSAAGDNLTTDLNDGIAFSGLSSVAASSLNTNDQSVAFSIEGAGEVSTASVSFTDVDHIVGNSGDSVSGDANWSLSGVAAARSDSSGILFSGEWQVTTSGGVLTGSNVVDYFALQSDGAVVANGLRFDGLDAVIGGLGDDDLDASAYTSGVQLVGTDSQVSAAGIVFQDIASVTTDIVTALASGSTFDVLGANSVLADAITFDGLVSVEGGAGSDTVTGADNWSIAADGAGNYASASESGSLLFRNIDRVQTQNGALTDSVGGDTITLAADSTLSVHGMDFTGLASMAAGGSGDLDASAYASGVTLSASDAVAAAGLTISGLNHVTVPVLNGTSADETFTVSDTASIAIAGYGMTFDGVSTVYAGEGSGDSDVVIAPQNTDHDISSASSLDVAGISFGQIELLDLNGGILTGTTGSDDFTLVNSNTISHVANTEYQYRNASEVIGGSGITTLTGTDQADIFALNSDGSLVANGLNFSGLTGVIGGLGDDELDASAYTNGVDLVGFTQQVSAAGIDFHDIASVTTDIVTALASGSTFDVLGANSVLADAITFDGLVSVEGGAGSDTVTGADNWSIAADGAGNYASASESGSLLFRNIDRVQTQNGALTDSVGGDTITLAADSTLSVHGMDFTGLASMAAGGSGDLDASAYASGVTLSASDAVAAAGLTISGLNHVTVPVLNGTSADETFTVSDTASIAIAGYGMAFDGVSTVYAGEGSDDSDVVIAPQNTDHDISSASAVSVAGISFGQIELLDLNGGILTGTAGSDDFALVNSNTISHVANTEFQFRNASGVIGGSGTTTLDATAHAGGLYLSNATGSSVTTQLNDGITFAGLSSAAVSSLNTNGQGVALTIDGVGAVSTNTVTFTQVNSIQGDGGDAVSGGVDWSLSGTTGAENDQSGILFSGAWQVAAGGVLTGTDQADSFELQSDGTLVANGLSFSGLTTVAGGLGDDELDALAFAGGVDLVGLDQQVSAAGIGFTDIVSVATEVLNALAGGSNFDVLAANSVMADAVAFVGLVSVEGGTGSDTVTGADNWTIAADVSGNYASATESGGLLFRNIERVETENGALSDTVGGDTISLAADSTLSVHGIDFTGLASMGADGSGELDASAYASGLALNGNEGEVVAGDLTVTGIAEAWVSNLSGSTGNDIFVSATNGDIDVRSMTFHGVKDVNAGGVGNSVTGADGFDWQIEDLDSALSNGIAFHGFAELTAVNGLLIGTLGDDIFTVSGSAAGGVEVALDQMTFTGVTGVDGGSGSNHLNGTSYSDALSLTGSDGQLDTGGLLFSNFASAQISVLHGYSTDENFVVTADDAISIAGLDISGLSEVYGEGGDNTLTALGKATLNKNGFAKNGNIKFYDISEIIADILEATDGDDLLAFDSEGNVTVNGVKISSTTYVDAKDGNDTVTGVDGLHWYVQGVSSAANNGVTFDNVEVVEVVNAGLYGTSDVDSFTLNADGNITVGSLAVSGMQFVDGNGGSDSLDASANTDGLVLSTVSGELLAGSLTLRGIASAITGVLTGTSGNEQFAVTGFGQLTADNMDFSGVTQLFGGGGIDELDSTVSDSWQLAPGASGVSHADIAFSGITHFAGGSGQLDGDDLGHQFAIDGNQLVSVGDLQFADVVVINAGSGTDQLATVDSVYLDATPGTMNSSGILISGIDAATASDLIGSVEAEQFALSGSGALSVNGIAFSGLQTVAAGDGNDEVVSRSGEDYALSVDNSVQHDGIVFTGVESFAGDSAELVATGQASARITASGSVVTGASIFTGLDALSLVGGATELEAWNGVALNSTGAITSGNMSVTGVTRVTGTGALSGTSGADEFTVSGSNTLSVADILFEDVAAVAAGAGSDRITGMASEGWQLGTGSGVVAHAGIDFSGVEQAAGGNGVLQGSNTNTSYSVTADEQLLAAGVQFDFIHTVNAGAGSDMVGTATGERWVLGDNNGSASAQGIRFTGIEQVATTGAQVDASANTIAEQFYLAADSAQLSVAGILFDEVAEVIAGVESGDLLTSDAREWQLASGSTALSVNGVSFAGIDRVETSAARLSGTGSDEQFFLDSADNGLRVSGITFSGIQDVIGNGGEDTLTGTAGDDNFALNASGDISVAAMNFSGITAVDSGNGVDTVVGDGALWSSALSNAGDQLVNGSAQAQVNSITVLFQNLEQVQAAGAYSGPNFATEYHLAGVNSLAIGGISYTGLDSITAGSAVDTLFGTDAALSWSLAEGQGTLSDGSASLAFYGFESIVAGAGADQFNLTGGTLLSLSAGAGNDVVNLRGTQIDTLDLGGGDDQVAVYTASRPTSLQGGLGSDLLQMNVAAQQWLINGTSAAENQVGNLTFSGFENLQDNGGGLALTTSQQFNFTASDDAAGVAFTSGGMQLAYDPAGDLVLVSSGTGSVAGSLKARNADLTLAGDLDIYSDVESISLRTSGGDIDVAIVANHDLQIGQINAGRGNVLLTSASANAEEAGGLGVLTVAPTEAFGNTNIVAGNILLGSGQRRWGNIGTEIKPLFMDASEAVTIVAFSYYEPIFVGQQPEFTATGDKLESVAGAQTSQGLKSALQNPVDDIAQLDPGIFSEVTPYSLGVDPLNLPEVRLHAGELVPLGEPEEKKRRRKAAAATGGK